MVAFLKGIGMKEISVSDEDLALYKEGGFIQFPSILTKGELRIIKKHIAHKIENLPPEVRPEYMDMCHCDDPFMMGLCLNDRILDVGESFIGSNIALFASHLISKRKGDGLKVPWHQDYAY